VTNSVSPIQGSSVASIRTRRLVLRPLRAGDAEPLFSLFGSWNVIRMLSTPPWPYRREDAEAFVNHAARGGFADRTPFAITLNGYLIGGIGSRLVQANVWQRGDGPNLAFWLGEPYWGRGYMTEAADALVRHIFATQDDEAIYSGALADNIASLQVQTKLGFVRDTEELIPSRPRGGRVPHVGTVLTRARFEMLERSRMERRAA
jgi:RimJ/RimL family protein N-acetyltransferase